MEIMKKPVAIYSRKSKFTGKGESIDNQIELCRQYIIGHYGKINAEKACIFEDEGFSGGNLERPQFKLMMQEAKKRKFSAIVCYRLDRISRNIGDFAHLIEQLNELEISFISIKEQFDTSSPMGRAMMYIASVFSQLERETIAERIRDNMHELSKTGRWLGGNTPTGYQSISVTSITIDGKQKKACQLERIPEEEKLVRKLFELFLDTGSLTKTETFLMQNGYKTRKGHLFSRFAIKGILSNPVYLVADMDAYDYLIEKKVDLFAEKKEFDGIHGIMAYNRTLQKPGKTHEMKEMEEWIVSVGKHEGIISGSVWVSAQRLLERNKSKNYRKPRSNVALLSGLLFCADCGSYMRPKVSGRVNENGEPIYSYLCSMKEKSRMKCCKMKNANGNCMDEMVWSELKKLKEDGSEFEKRLIQGKKTLTIENRGNEVAIGQIEEELEKTESQIESLVASLTNAGGTKAEVYIVNRIDALHQYKEEKIAQLECIKKSIVSNELKKLEFDLLVKSFSSFEGTIDQMNVIQKRTAIGTLVKKVVWDGETIHLHLFGSEQDSFEPQGEDSK